MLEGESTSRNGGRVDPGPAFGASRAGDLGPQRARDPRGPAAQGAVPPYSRQRSAEPAAGQRHHAVDSRGPDEQHARPPWSEDQLLAALSGTDRPVMGRWRHLRNSGPLLNPPASQSALEAGIEWVKGRKPSASHEVLNLVPAAVMANRGGPRPKPHPAPGTSSMAGERPKPQASRPANTPLRGRLPNQWPWKFKIRGGDRGRTRRRWMAPPPESVPAAKEVRPAAGHNPRSADAGCSGPRPPRRRVRTAMRPAPYGRRRSASAAS